jgi:hypothetical protein
LLPRYPSAGRLKDFASDEARTASMESSSLGL